jgi:hypothetical protein
MTFVPGPDDDIGVLIEAWQHFSMTQGHLLLAEPGNRRESTSD